MKECCCLNQYYCETYLNVYRLKIGVLLSNHENHFQTIFLLKNIINLLFYFLSQHFLNLCFHICCKCLIFDFLHCQVKFFCILYKRSIIFLWSLVINKSCIILEIAQDLNIVILSSKVKCLMRVSHF